MKTEHEEQVELCKWLRKKKIHHVGIPNAQGLSAGNRGKAARNMQKLKLEGFQKGFPDMLVFLPGKLLAIELKRMKGGVVGEEQEKWKSIIRRYPYADAYVCNGCDNAITLISSLL